MCPRGWVAAGAATGDEKRLGRGIAGGLLHLDDPERLYGEVGRLKMELDWLKKKSGISL